MTTQAFIAAFNNQQEKRAATEDDFWLRALEDPGSLAEMCSQKYLSGQVEGMKRSGPAKRVIATHCASSVAKKN